MGKSTVATMMRNLKIPVHDSDACVHDLLSIKNPAHYHVTSAFPYFEYPHIYDKKTKELIRSELGKIVFQNDELRLKLEAILHPLVQNSQADFIKNCSAKRYDIVCLDIPLLYETKAEKRVDYVIVVSAPAFLQRERVMARPHMTEEKFQTILSRQMSDFEKCARADFIIKNGLSRSHTIKQLKTVLLELSKKSQSPEQTGIENLKEVSA